MWSKFPKNTPNQTGYYFTYYYNDEIGKHLYKAISWDGHQWVGWRRGGLEFVVKGYIDITNAPYYGSCLQITDDIKLKPFYNNWIEQFFGEAKIMARKCAKLLRKIVLDK